MARVGRTAPPLSLVSPLEPVRPGQPIPCSVNLSLPRAVWVRALRVEVVGHFRRVVGVWRIGPWRRWRWTKERVVHTQASLPLGRLVGPGATSFRLEVPLPADAPPSARGKAVSMGYTLRASLDIPHAPDRWEEVPLVVTVMSPAEEPGPSPSQALSRVQVLLEAPRCVHPGQRIQGTLWISASHPLVLADLRVELVRLEQVPPWAWAFSTSRVPLSALSLGAYEKRQVPFTLLVPPDAPPTCALPHGCAIGWAFRVRALGHPLLAEEGVVVEGVR